MGKIRTVHLVEATALAGAGAVAFFSGLCDPFSQRATMDWLDRISTLFLLIFFFAFVRDFHRRTCAIDEEGNLIGSELIHVHIPEAVSLVCGIAILDLAAVDALLGNTEIALDMLIFAAVALGIFAVTLAAELAIRHWRPPDTCPVTKEGTWRRLPVFAAASLSVACIFAARGAGDMINSDGRNMLFGFTIGVVLGITCIAFILADRAISGHRTGWEKDDTPRE